MVSIQEWKTIDRTGWPSGEWDNEPDKIVWLDNDTGYPCMIVRSPVTGSLCGYVGINSHQPRHPDFQKHYETLSDIDVHGGLTFSNWRDERFEDKSIWWFGFDCAHLYDRSPAMEAHMPSINFEGCIYRDLPYVISEVAKLAAQLKLREIQ